MGKMDMNYEWLLWFFLHVEYGVKVRNVETCIRSEVNIMLPTCIMTRIRLSPYILQYRQIDDINKYRFIKL